MPDSPSRSCRGSVNSSKGPFAPGVTTAALSIARANGKTALMAGVACATLDGPLALPRGETILVASSFEQARVAFEHVLAFLGDKLEDKKTWRIWDTAQQAAITNRVLKTRVRCIGSDPRRAHGLAPTLVLADEPAQWLENQSERMVAALQTASGKQQHSRFIAIGTRPESPEHWFEKMLEDGADYSQNYATDQSDDPFSMKVWHKANPSLRYFPDLKAAMKKQAERAKRDASVLQSFRALMLNQGISDVIESVLLTAETWRGVEVEGLVGEGPYVLGIDLGGSAAMSAASAYWPQNGRLDSFACFPNEPTLEARGLFRWCGQLVYPLCGAWGTDSGRFSSERYTGIAPRGASPMGTAWGYRL